MSTKCDLWLVDTSDLMPEGYRNLPLNEFDNYEDAVSYALFWVDDTYYKIWGPIGVSCEHEDEPAVLVRLLNGRDRKTAIVTKDGQLLEYHRKP